MDADDTVLDQLMDPDEIDSDGDAHRMEDSPANPPASANHHADLLAPSFPQFSQLPAELRLLIWEAAADQQAQVPRVVNMSVRGQVWDRSPRPRLHVTNKSWLQADPRAASLLRTNREARAAASAFLQSHPRLPGRTLVIFIAGNSTTVRLGRAFATPLCQLCLDPTRDILFLNGLDLYVHARAAPTPTEPGGEAAISLVLPHGLSAWGAISPTWVRYHAFRLNIIEHQALCQFRTVVMPVQGLVQQAEEGQPSFFTDIFSQLAVRSCREPVSCRRTFIALVGRYRGGNLQMDDIEFIPDEELKRVREEAREQVAHGRAKSVLDRDVLVMTAIWAQWTYGAAEVFDVNRDMVLMDGKYGPAIRRTLQFARVKQGVCAEQRGERISRITYGKSDVQHQSTFLNRKLPALLHRYMADR